MNSKEIEQVLTTLLEIDARVQCCADDLNSPQVDLSSQVDTSSRVDKSSLEDQDLLWREISGVSTRISLQMMKIVQKCSNSSVGKSKVRVHAPAMRPRGVNTENMVFPVLGKLLLQRKWLQHCNVVGFLLSAVFYYLVIFDFLRPWWFGLLSLGGLLNPILIASTSNYHLLKNLATTWQTILVWLYVTLMFGSFAFLFRNYPSKLLAMLLGLASYYMSGCLDAFPESGRVQASRTFFILNAACLLVLAGSIVWGLAELDDHTFEYFGHSYSISSLATNTVYNLVPFALKNIIMSILKPGSLVVFKSDVVSVKLSSDILSLMKGAHSLFVISQLEDDRQRPNKTLKIQLKRHKKSILNLRERARITPVVVHV